MARTDQQEGKLKRELKALKPNYLDMHTINRPVGLIDLILWDALSL